MTNEAINLKHEEKKKLPRPQEIPGNVIGDARMTQMGVL
jgi:hypothetical protein